MKVKNIVFSGVMAAILGATSANAAVTVASQGYVDSKVGAVETNITNNYLTKGDARNTYLTEAQVTEQITNVVGTSENGVLADVVANKTAIAGLQSSKANTADVYSKTDADSTFATKDALSAVETTANAAATKTYVDTEFAKYTTTADLNTTLNSYATTTALKAEEDARKAADQAATSALSGKQDSLSETQLGSVNSGVTAATVAQIATNTTEIAKKANADTLTLLATANVPEACQSESNTCVLSMTSDGTFAWTPLTATPTVTE